MPAPISTVAAVIADSDCRVLLARKRDSAIFIQPGLKREPGEASLLTRLRELKSEPAIELQPETARSASSRLMPTTSPHLSLKCREAAYPRNQENPVQIHRTVYREDHELLRATARRFFERECVPRQAQWDEAGEVDRETWLKAGREGLLCLTVPTEYGGGGGDFGHTAVVAEELHHAGLSGWSLSVHSDIVAPYIVRLGTAEQKERWLPKICRGECVMAVAMTEPGTGSDLKAIRTTAQRDGDDFIINGSKTFISNGRQCDMVVVVCKTEPEAGAKGVSLIMVESDRDGFRRGRKLQKVGQPAADTAEMFFDNVRVPASNLLGIENRGFIHLMEELPQERLIIAVYTAAKLERMLEHTLDYVKGRRAFNQTVWDFQNTKFKLADIQAQANAVRTLVDYYIGEHMRRKLTAQEAAIAKLFATETTWKCIDEMVQLHGGYGYMLEYPIARAFTDMRVTRIFGGTSEVLRELIARKL